MCVACNSPVAIVWHEVDKANKLAVRAEIRHREELLQVAHNLPDKVSFKLIFVAEANRKYVELVDYYNETFTDVWYKPVS